MEGLPNPRVDPAVRPTTPRACARVSPGRPAGHARRWPDYEMRSGSAALLLSMTLATTGCAKPDVRHSELEPAPTATLVGSTLTIHLGYDKRASACWTRLRARTEGQTVYLVGYRTTREHRRDSVVQLPASTASQAVSVVWIDPDGTRVPVPIAR